MARHAPPSVPTGTPWSSGPSEEPQLLQAEHELLLHARQQQTQASDSTRYALRAGVQATVSQGSAPFGLRRSHRPGLEKTHLQHVLTAAAINLVRVDAWLTERLKLARATSRFAALYSQMRAALWHDEFANSVRFYRTRSPPPASTVG